MGEGRADDSREHAGGAGDPAGTGGGLGRPPPKVIRAFVPDLMDRSRLNGIPGVEFVASPDALAAEGADVVVVDLSRPGVLDALARLIDVRTIGFGSHVDRDLLAAARDAGCDLVLTRSGFFRRLGELLG